MAWVHVRCPQLASTITFLRIGPLLNLELANLDRWTLKWDTEATCFCLLCAGGWGLKSRVATHCLYLQAGGSNPGPHAVQQTLYWLCNHHKLPSCFTFLTLAFPSFAYFFHSIPSNIKFGSVFPLLLFVLHYFYLYSDILISLFQSLLEIGSSSSGWFEFKPPASVFQELRLKVQGFTLCLLFLLICFLLDMLL